MPSLFEKVITPKSLNTNISIRFTVCRCLSPFLLPFDKSPEACFFFLVEVHRAGMMLVLGGGSTKPSVEHSNGCHGSPQGKAFASFPHGKFLA